MILFVYNINEGITSDDLIILNEVDKYNKPIIKLANKADLLEVTSISNNTDLEISAITGTNITKLKQCIKDTVLGTNFKVQQDEVYINMRHKECLNKALNHLKLSLEALERDEVHDLISIDIKSALLSLDEIVGEVLTENIVERIFSQFCVGK